MAEFTPIRITEDSFLGGGLLLRQPADGYRAAIDPVFLAAAVPARPGQQVLDVGAGVGTAALCLARRAAACRVTGLEIQPDLARLAGENAMLNDLADRVEVLCGSLTAPPAALAPGTFHHVMTNPPFLAADQARLSANIIKATANVEGDADLAAWMRFCIAMLHPKGSLTIIHRADRLDEILGHLRGRLGDITILPLWPKRDRPAKRVIIQARKGVNAPLTLAQGIILHEEDGSFTAAADRVLRGGGGFGRDA